MFLLEKKTRLGLSVTEGSVKLREACFGIFLMLGFFFCQVYFFPAAIKTFKWSHSEYINTFYILNLRIQDVIVVIVTYIQL